jgi:hypothetical protein
LTAGRGQRRVVRMTTAIVSAAGWPDSCATRWPG